VNTAARHLHPSMRRVDGALDEHVLAEIAAGLAATTACGPAIRRGAVSRRRLLATASYDAWLLQWGPGAQTDAHDHDGSIGVASVIAGRLLEIDLADRSRPFVREVPSGGHVAFGIVHHHVLRNPSAGSAAAVQVFSPPLGPA
jgi:hypothetical protein